jgi:hypothetical protein
MLTKVTLRRKPTKGVERRRLFRNCHICGSDTRVREIDARLNLAIAERRDAPAVISVEGQMKGSKMNYRSILAATAGVIGMVAVSAIPASAQRLVPVDEYQQGYGWSPSPYASHYSPYASHYNDGYYAYGSAVVVPQGRYDRRGAYDRDTPAPGSSRLCVGDQNADSAFPSWMCR